MTEATWALVGVTSFLAVITFLMALQNHRIVGRMDLQRKESIRPLLTFQILPWQPTLIKLRIENLGSGPAFEIKGKIIGQEISGSEVAFDWSYPVLGPGKYEEFGMPPADADGNDRFNIDLIRSRLNSVTAQFKYKSASNESYEIDKVIEIGPLSADWLDSRMMATADHPERLMPRIAKGIENIATALNKP